MMPGVARGLRPVRETLDNGAVLIVQESAATPAVTISATFLAGSMYEPDHLTGLAYLTGRVIDRGTERRSAEEMAEELDERGVSLRVGCTRHTLTLSCTCLAEDFDDVLAMVVDVARRPTFPDDELTKRRAEVMTALRQDEDNPAVVAVEGLAEMLYGGAHPYGRGIKGTCKTLELMDRDALAGYHGRHIRPSALSLVVVGDIESGRAIERAAAEIEGWRSLEAASAAVLPPAPEAVRRRRSVSMPGKAQSDIAYGFTTISRLDPAYYAYWMMNNVLGQFGLGGRLADNIRERQGMAYYAYSAFDAMPGPSPLVIRAGVDPHQVERALAAIDAEVHQLGLEGPTETEVEETRQYLVGSIPRLLETNYSIAGFLQMCEQLGLGLDYDQRLPTLLQQVTIDEIRAAASDVLRPDVAAVSVAGPELQDEAHP